MLSFNFLKSFKGDLESKYSVLGSFYFSSVVNLFVLKSVALLILFENNSFSFNFVKYISISSFIFKALFN